MTYQQAALALFASFMLAGQQGQAPAAQTPAPTPVPAAPHIPMPVNREEALRAKLKALLEPLGITVEKDSLIDADKVRSVKFLTAEWEAYPGITEKMLPAEKLKDRPPAKTVRLVESKTRQFSETPMQRRYGFQLTTEELFIAAVDAKSQLKWWEVTTDPRIIRGEWPGPDGQLTGVLYYSTRPGIHITIPDVGEITEVRIFLPRWDGALHTLDQLATIPVSN